MQIKGKLLLILSAATMLSACVIDDEGSTVNYPAYSSGVYYNNPRHYHQQPQQPPQSGVYSNNAHQPFSPPPPVNRGGVYSNNNPQPSFGPPSMSGGGFRGNGSQIPHRSVAPVYSNQQASNDNHGGLISGAPIRNNAGPQSNSGAVMNNNPGPQGAGVFSNNR